MADREGVEGNGAGEGCVLARDEVAGDKRQEVQRVLEEALLAVGLEELLVADGDATSEEGAGSRRRGKEEAEAVGSNPGRCTVQRELSMEAGDPERPLSTEEECGESSELVRVKPAAVERGERGGSKEGSENLPKNRRIAAVRTEWTDITTLFTQAALQLAQGELVKELSFSLLGAMSAVEMLDPKMDASMHWASFRGYPWTVEEAVRSGRLQLDNHSPSRIVGIFDEVFACIATWLDGHTMAQTLFTCLYLLDTGRLEDPHLRAFSLAIVKVCEYIRECICRGGVSVEEDQQGVCFGFNMLGSVDDATVFAALKELEDRASSLARHSAREDRQRDREKMVVSDETELLKSLLVRARFVRNLFGLTTCLRKCLPDSFQAIADHLSQCLTLLPDMISSCPLGEKLDPSDPLKLGFHPLINHNLLPPSYKPCAIVPRLDAFSSLQTILIQLQTVLDFGRLDSFKALHTLSGAFCARDPTPNVFVRSAMVLVCMQSERTKLFGSPSMEDMLKKDVREFCNPPSLNPRSPLFSSAQGKELTERFFGRTIAPMYELLRMYSQHRARQQEKAERVLDFLADLQHETERIDHLHNDLALKVDPGRQHLACYSSWVLYYTLCVMIDYVVLGLEFKLYSPFEFHYVFWYLEYLYGWLHTTFKSANRLNADSQAAPKGKKKGKKAKKDAAEKRERDMTLVQVKRVVCVALMRSFEALILDGKVPYPSFEYGSEALCFHHRFASFASISTPQLLTYQDYHKLAGIHNYKGLDINLYDAAARHFTSAKAALENLPHPSEELQGLIRAIKTNVVVMNLAAKGHKKESKNMAILDFSLHKHFPVIRIN